MKLSKLSTKTKTLIGCGTFALLFFIGIGGYFGWKIYTLFSEVSRYSLRREIPDELREPRVLKGADFLAKTEIFKLSKDSYGTTIKKGATAADEKEKQKIISSSTAKGIYGFDDIKICGEEIVAAGKFGAEILDFNGNFRREILFEPTLTKVKMGWFKHDNYKPAVDNLQIIDLDSDGKCEFFSFGFQEGVTAYNSDGNIIWKYGGEETADVFQERDIDNEVYVTEAAAGDLDGDGIAEYIVGRANDGIRAFDRNGGEKWFQPAKYPSATMRVFDIDGDGRSEFLELGGASKIRDAATGNVVRELKGGSSSDAIVFGEDKNKKKALQFCDIDDNKLICVDENAAKFIEAEAPLSKVKSKAATKTELPKATPIDMGNGIVAAPMGEPISSADDDESVYQPKAAWVSLKKDKPKYLAVVASFIGIPRAHLYIYEPNGTLVYHELLPEDAETLAVIPANQTEEIVIGAKDTIWKFTAK